MPRLQGVKERRHQPFWDTLIRTTGDPGTAVPQSKKIFGSANIGNVDLTNLQVAGQLASDQTMAILALRCWLHFDGTYRRSLYLGVATQLYWTLILGDKPQFQAPTWYFPAGGGTWGFDSGTSMFNNGTPEQSSIMKLARPLMVPVRQNISVSADWYPVGSVDIRNATGTSINDGAADDQKVIMFVLDGLQTRDVQ